MIRALWISKTGLDAQQTNMDVIANNLANVSTNGFKRQRAVFEDLLYQTLRQPGAQSSQQTMIPSGLQLGTGARPIATEKLFTQGATTQTSNPLDLAINGQGFFQIQLPDGTLAYTRDGAFQRDSTGSRYESPGNHVEYRSLSRAVGSDQPEDLSLADAQVEPTDRCKAPKEHGQAACLKDFQFMFPLRCPDPYPSFPRGSKDQRGLPA